MQNNAGSWRSRLKPLPRHLPALSSLLPLAIELDRQLDAPGWPQAEVSPFKKNLEGALNQGAYVMQTLRVIGRLSAADVGAPPSSG
jgi:hypothetical protein